MKRLTRAKDQYECRIAGGCPAEDWIEDIIDYKPHKWAEEPCDNCPFEKYINRLAEMEDMEELMEDDKK